MDLTIEIDRQEGQDHCTVTLTGSLDTETHGAFEEKMRTVVTAPLKGILFDMEKLCYISSIGFASIFRIKQAVENNGGTLAFANLQPNVKKVFDALKVIPESIFATLQEADDYLDQYIAFINSDKNGPPPGPRPGG